MSHVFVSYVHDNKNTVDQLCADLKAAGVEVWLDRESIKPGQRWRPAIRGAIKDGAFFIACFSAEYTQKAKSYMNEELTFAIDELRQRPIDRTWFIPVRLSKCEIPARSIGGGESLQDIQWVALFENWSDGVDRILEVVAPHKKVHTGLQKVRQRRITNVTARSIGIVRFDETGHPVVVNVIQADGRIPAAEVIRFATRENMQTKAEFQFMDNTSQAFQVEISECKEIGKVELEFNHPLPKGSPLELHLSLGPDGFLSVTGLDLTSGGKVAAKFETEAVMIAED